MVLTRENIKNGFIQDMVRAGGDLMPCLPEAEIVASYRRSIADVPEGGEYWVFGYGSLIWNPAFHFEERRIARLHGYHRRFCLWTHLGRGSPERPGMVLGLERGGSCVGVALRIAPEKVEEEFDVIWRREMVSGAYLPRWVRLYTDEGPIWSIAFVINREHPRYAQDVAESEIVGAISTAEGPLGPCAEYLLNTVDHLAELGIRDRPLGRLAEQVRRRWPGRAAAAPDGS